MLEWNVYISDFNSGIIKKFNIFNHTGFTKYCKKIYERYGNNKELFLANIKSGLIHFFWSKCEWEIVLSDWPPSDSFNDEKIDVYDQIEMNWGAFSDYLWTNRALIEKIK